MPISKPDKRALYANANAYAESEEYQDYIIRHFYDSTSSAYGHTLNFHYRKSDGYLRKRCIRYKVSGATTFLHEKFHLPSDISDYIVKNVLFDAFFSHEVCLWLLTTDCDTYNMIIDDPNGEMIGYGYVNSSTHDWRNGPLYTDRLCIVFERLAWGGFVIKTAYPYLAGMDNDA